MPPEHLPLCNFRVKFPPQKSLGMRIRQEISRLPPFRYSSTNRFVRFSSVSARFFMILSRYLQLSIVITCAAASTQAHAQTAIAEVSPWAQERPKLNTTLINPPVLSEESPPAPEIPEDSAPALSDKDFELSPLEDMYSERVVDQLQQFGYDLFGSPAHTPDLKSLPAGAAQDDFVLSIGDEVSIVMRGQRQARMTSQITGEGLLIIDELTPIPAAGRTLKQVREELESDVAQLYNTDVFLSLTKVNQVNVLIVGNVAHPGRQTLTAFDTVLDALTAAGGIEKTGSLRQIRVIRDGRTMMVDLYGLLMYGSDTADLSLRNGDKIMVPPLGPTVAVSGGVKRPGIYEILPAIHASWMSPDQKSQMLSASDLLDMAGGVLSTAQNRYLRLDINSNGEEAVQDIGDPLARVFSDGDILTVERGKERREGTVELSGHAHAAGIHALKEVPSLHVLLSKEQSFERDIYPLIGVIERWNKNDLSRELIAFPPALALKGQYDRKLADGDIVHLFSHQQIAALRAEPKPEADQPMGSADINEDAPPGSVDRRLPAGTQCVRARCDPAAGRIPGVGRSHPR